jgi:hypothetical protein
MPWRPRYPRPDALHLKCKTTACPWRAAAALGPLNLQPRPGKAWRPVGKPTRLRATYTGTDGVRHMLAASDLATGKLFYRTRDRKRCAPSRTALLSRWMCGTDAGADAASASALRVGDSTPAMAGTTTMAAQLAR